METSMIIKCSVCGSATKVLRGQRYHYKECGLDNVYLDNIEVRVCEKCKTVTPRIPRILEMHSTIARAIALQPYPLSGADIRFLRKHLGLKAKEWAALLRTNHTTLSRWENDDQKLGPQSDSLVRLLYFRMLEEKEGRMFAEPVAGKIAATKSKRGKLSKVFVNVNNPAVYSYQSV
jgi:putative zinc finger/helix-turn-helix YgiT family protein